MTEKFSDDRWNTFENSGRVEDYLYFKGIGGKKLPTSKGECGCADNNGGCGDISQRLR